MQRWRSVPMTRENVLSLLCLSDADIVRERQETERGYGEVRGRERHKHLLGWLDVVRY